MADITNITRYTADDRRLIKLIHPVAKGRRAGLVGAKFMRMPWIAANGILILVPAALFLASKAQAAAFDTVFYGVQALELVVGATNITLLSLNMRDGLRIRGRFRRRSA